MQKIGILGGTFNPIHNGHIQLGKNAQISHNLDKILFIPSNISYMKVNHGVLPANLRADMVQLAIESEPTFEYCDIELVRGGNSYTYETILELAKQYDNAAFYYIIGADTLFNIERWRNISVIFDNCIILCAHRDQLSLPALKTQKNKLKKMYNAQIEFLQNEEITISSSEIRDRIIHGKSVSDLLPENVFRYITQNQLYVK